MLLAREENVPRLIIHELASGEAHEIAFEAQTYYLRNSRPVYEFDYAGFPLQLSPRWPAARRPTTTTWRSGSASC